MAPDREELMAYMRPVLAAERDLRELSMLWRMIEASAAIGCPGEAGQIQSTLADTRQRMDELRTHLLEQMVEQNRAELGDELGAKAQCAIDILVRNLYERTADVGFLATDDLVRAFCAAPPERRAAERPAMVRRLAQYQSKYTVYDDVILLSPQGELLARLDEDGGAPGTQSRLAADALACPAYLERFGASELARDALPVLLYANGIRDASGRPLGVLVLRFRFADEMRRIFEGVVDDPHRVVLTLIDARDAVIASSDEAHIPVGIGLPSLRTGATELTSFAGRQYMALCCASQGYQGYAGPPWRAIAMVPLLTAFRQHPDEAGAVVPLDNPELAAVQSEARAIHRELRRALWNGRLRVGHESADSARLKAVLQQMSFTAARTRSRVTQATHDIYRVALSRSRHQVEELARLAADIMDRNLYERANDCRWWALSPVVRRVLAEPASVPGDRALHEVLAHINSLYTVYSQIVAFDHGGRIRAVSVAQSAQDWVGQPVPAAWSSAVQALSNGEPNGQRYAVSAFEPTPLHDQGATYVYFAAVRDAAGQRLVGGIAIVFNAARELNAILRDVIGERAGVAAFVDIGNRVLVANDTALADTLAARMDATKGATGMVLEQAGVHYACARVQAPGYREFKTSDGYDHGVSAVFALRLGPAERRRAQFSEMDLEPPTPAGRLAERTAQPVEMAVFQIASSRYALPVGAVVAAIPQNALVRTPAVRGATIGMIEVEAALGTASPRGTGMVRVLCARRLFGIDSAARQEDGVVLVLRAPDDRAESMIGLRVDDVLSVLEVGPADLHAAPRGLQQLDARIDMLINCRISGQEGKALVQLLSHAELFADMVRDTLSPKT